GPWRRSRAAREFDALAWMAAHGLSAPAPIAVFERRRFGLLARAVLVTAASPGTTASDCLPELPPDERFAAAAAIGAFVASLHALGFRDRNLDLRNLLVQRRPGGGWLVEKIDSPRHRLRRGAGPDALSRADWQRLLPQLAAL